MVTLTGADGRELSMIDTPEKAMEGRPCAAPMPICC
jgi:hypothetical protein